MPSPRGEERWVAACIEAALPGVTVKPNDDGSRPGMYDLDLLRAGAPFGACEVTAAADAASIELWNLINCRSERWVETDLLGGWIVGVSPACRAKRLRKELPGLLRVLEAGDVGVGVQDTDERLADLGVVSVHRGATDYPGSIYLTIRGPAERTGGAVPRTGDSLVFWLNAWICESMQEHNLQKLRSAERDERHLFVLLPGFTTAPFPVADLLMRAEAPVPDFPLRMPDGITHVWAMSTWDSGDVFRFASGAWHRSKKVFGVSGDS